jgi:hypothetical protein
VTRLLTALLLVLVSSVAEARMKAGPVVMSNHVRERVAVSAGAGPPGMPTAAVAYSLRKLVGTAVATQAVRIRRASDNAEQDIGFVGNDFDTVAATTFCAATTCFGRTLYDQTLTRRDAVMATPASQPDLIFGCTVTGQPCLRTTTGTGMKLATTSFTPSSAVMSMNAVSRRVSGTGACYDVTGSDNNRIQHTNGSAGYTLLANAGVVASVAGATENTWHSVTGIINGASSSLVADATTASGTGTGSVAAGPNTVLLGATSTTCYLAEAIWWDATALTAQQAADLNANQKAYWGF